MKVPVGLYMTQFSALTREDIENGDTEKIVAHAFPSHIDHAPDGWTLIGTGEAEITLLTSTEITAGLVADLKAQLNAHRANAMRIETELQGRINDLLALPEKV